jgi:hypothetical protein
MDIGNKIWEAKCTYIYLRSSYSADRTFSETERPRALLTFLYDKLHMEPLLLPSEELLSRVISPCSQKNTSRSSDALRQHPGHVTTDSGVVEQTLDLADSGDGNVAVPELALGEVHDIVGGNGANNALDLFRRETAAGGDNLASNVLSDGGGAIKGQKDGGLELSLGTLNLGLAHVEAEARPLTESEVHEVIQTSNLVRNKVDTPETSV